jgi:hypothetical protein
LPPSQNHLGQTDISPDKKRTLTSPLNQVESRRSNPAPVAQFG